jgi:D-alanyl-D-alanine carboxypeptidase
VRNHNRLLWNFDGAIGGKTGYTHAAQKCFVGAVTRNGVTLIVSILGARDLWGDTKRLLEYGFDNYQTVKPPTQPASKLTTTEHVSVRQDRISAVIATPQGDDKPTFADGYVLQVGAFRERDRAESVLKTFSAKGLEVYVEKTSLSTGQTAYRVRVGPYAELLEAQEVAREILAKTGMQALIVPARAPQEIADNPD